jgi:hypothetical protein
MAGRKDHAGLFKKGQSGNPTGRPRVIAKVRDIAREYTEEAIDALVRVVRDKKSPAAAVVAAASAILDRGYGKPTQTIEANVNVLDKLQPTELAALEAALASIADDASAGDQTAVN